MNKAVRIFSVGFSVLSFLMLYGCSPKGNDAGKELNAAVKMFDDWRRGDQGSGSARGYSRPLTPEETMGLQKPEDLAPAVYAWIKDTEYGEYYRRSRESLAVLYKKLMDDYRVRNASGVRPTDYTGELMRSWRNAYNADYGLRGLIVECYSRKELLPMPQGLARYFTAEKEAREKTQQQLNNARAEERRLSSELSSVRRELESIGEVSWSQKRSVDEWGKLQVAIDRLCTQIGNASSRAETLVVDVLPMARANGEVAVIRDLYRDVEKLSRDLSDIERTSSERRKIIDGQVTVFACTDKCVALEAELENLKAEMASAGALTWADEKDVKTWDESLSVMSVVSARADRAKASAAELVQKVGPIVQIGNGDAGVAALGERVEKLHSSLSDLAGSASERRTIAKGKSQLVKCSVRCSALETELAGINAAFGNMTPVSWADDKAVEAWQSLHGPAAELASRAGRANSEAASLAEIVKPICRSSNGDKTIAAFDARIEKLNASLSAVVEKTSERLAIAKGQVPLTKFINRLREMATEMRKIPAALGKKNARMREIENIERQVRESRTRNYSDLDELASKVAEIKARSLAERTDEIALGRRVQRMVNTREAVIGFNAMYRLKMQVPEKAAHEKAAAEAEAFKRTLDISADSALPGFFANIESKAYRLVDVMDEDAMLQRLEETLRTVQRLAARGR